MATQMELNKIGVARLHVGRIIRQELYKTDTPDFRVEVLTTFRDDTAELFFLTTDLPDGMMYLVAWPIDAAEPLPVQAFQKIEIKDIRPHD